MRTCRTGEGSPAFARLCHVADGNDARSPAKPIVARRRREQGGRNADVNAPPCKGQKRGGSSLRVGTGIVWFALASCATDSGGNLVLLMRSAVHTADAC